MTNTIRHLAVAAGLGIGATLAAPMSAYGLELPAGSLKELAGNGAAMFAAGLVTGVVATSIVALIVRHRAKRRAAKAEEEAKRFESARTETPLPFVPLDDDDTAVTGEISSPGITSRFRSRLSSLTHQHEALDGVPVITRASNALSEREAWAEIDAALSGPINCNPETSHDIYQIALAELSGKAAPQAAAKSPEQTAEEERQADAAAALRTLDDTGDNRVNVAVATPRRTYAPVPDIPVMRTDPQSASAEKAPAASAAPVAAVPMADYSGHENVWAAALAELGDAPVEAVPAKRAAQRAQAPAASDPSSTSAFLTAARSYQAPAGARTSDPSSTSAFLAMASARTAQVVEGSRASAVHAAPSSYLAARSRVDAILNEETERLGGAPVPAAQDARPRLSVVDGGTESFLRASSGQLRKTM